jgi:DNA-directed RNA polymerase specialized sigma24 family protein
MKAMQLCLDREQRLIFILGELLEFPDSVGSEIMEISKENFRIKLHRAKQWQRKD